MQTSVRAGEARLYWCAVSTIRLADRETSDHPTNEQRDDLEVLLIHSEWPLVRNRAKAFLAKTDDTPRANIGG